MDDSTCRVDLQGDHRNTNPCCTSGVPEIMEDSISKILERRGIKYSHRNDEILIPNTIEEHRMKKARKVRTMGFVWIGRASNSHRLLFFEKKERRQRERKVKSQETLEEHGIEWPPKREHHTRPPSPRTKYVLPSRSHGFPLFVVLNASMTRRLSQRQMALIELGMITSPEDIPTFAQNLYVSCCPPSPRVSFSRADMLILV